MSSSPSFSPAKAAISELAGVVANLGSVGEEIDRGGCWMVETLKAGHKVLTCGNGGSAADAMHLVEELLGCYRSNRVPLPAVGLASDPTSLTCIANDFGYGEVFARQVTALGQPGDLLVGISTSGNSVNVLNAFAAARQKGVRTIALTGRDGGRLKSESDLAIVVPSQNTARIQECHTLALHVWLEHVEAAFPAEPNHGRVGHE